MNDRLKRQLEFSLEIDKVKNIFRQTHLSGKGRPGEGEDFLYLTGRPEKRADCSL